MSQEHSQSYEVGKAYSVVISALNPNPHQPRKYFDETELQALAKDIDANGLLQNITFTRHEGELVIVSGERRVRACKLLGKEEIEGKYVEGDLQTLALMENILRSDLTAVELAESVAALKEQQQCSNDNIAALIGKQKSTVSEILKIASLPESIRNDARAKPHMTRERLLKVARRKDDAEKGKTYEKLCASLEKQATPLQTRKSESKPQKKGRAGNRYVNAQVRVIENLAERLETSHKKMLEQIGGEIQEEDKDALRRAFAYLRAVIVKYDPPRPPIELPAPDTEDLLSKTVPI